MKPCNERQSKSSTLYSTTNTKSSTNHSTCANSKYYQLNIDYSPEKESIQLRFTPDSSQGTKESGLKAEEVADNINKPAASSKNITKPDLNDCSQNQPAKVAPVPNKDDKKEKKFKSKHNIYVVHPVSTAASNKSCTLKKTIESSNSLNIKKMPSQGIIHGKGDKHVCTKHKHIKEHSKETSGGSKDLIKYVTKKQSKSKRIQTSRSKMGIDELDSRRKKNKSTYVEQKEIYYAADSNNPFSVAAIPGLQGKSGDHGLNTKSSTIKKHRHKRKKQRHPSLDTECKDLQSVPSESLDKHTVHQVVPVENKPKGMGLLYLKNKLLGPANSKNYADMQAQKNKIANLVVDEITKYKSKHSKNMNDYSGLILAAEFKKQKHNQQSSKNVVAPQSDDIKVLHTRHKCRDSVDTENENKKPKELDSATVADNDAVKKHKKIQDCSSNSFIKNDRQDKRVSKTELKHKHSKRESKNELPKVVSTKIKHRDSKYKKSDAAVNVKAKSSDPLICNPKRKESSKDIDSQPNYETGKESSKDIDSQPKDETDKKKPNTDNQISTLKKHRHSKNKYNESLLTMCAAQTNENVKGKESLVTEFSELVYKKKTKHKKKGALDSEYDINYKSVKNEVRPLKEEPAKKMKNKKVDTESLGNIDAEFIRHHKHRHRRKRSKSGIKSDKSNADTVIKEIHHSSNHEDTTIETKPEDNQEKFENIEAPKENSATKNDDKRQIKISRDQLEAFLWELTGKSTIKESNICSYNIPNNDMIEIEDMHTLRKEVSFSHLNLDPVTALYSPTRASVNGLGDTHATSVLRNIIPAPKEKKSMKSKKKKLCDEKSVVSEAITKKEKCQYVNGKRFQTKSSPRHVAESAEKARKQVQQNGCFSVKGVQPLNERKPSTAPSLSLKRNSSRYFPRRLQKTVISVVEIKPKCNFVDGLLVHKPNEKLLTDDLHGTSNIPISKIYKTKAKKACDTSSDKTSKSSTSGVDSVQVTYFRNNLEKDLQEQQTFNYGYNDSATAKQSGNLSQNNISTQSALGNQLYLQRDMLEDQATDLLISEMFPQITRDVNQYPGSLTNYSRLLKERNAKQRSEASPNYSKIPKENSPNKHLENSRNCNNTLGRENPFEEDTEPPPKIRMQIRKRTKVPRPSRRKWFQGSSLSSREPSTDREQQRSLEESEKIPPAKINKLKVSKAPSPLKKYGGSTLTSPKSSKNKMPNPSPSFNGIKSIKPALPVTSPYSKPQQPATSLSISSGFSVTSQESYKNPFRSIHAPSTSLKRPVQGSNSKEGTGPKVDKPLSGHEVRSRIKQYAERLHEKRRRFSRESSLSSKSSTGKNNININRITEDDKVSELQGFQDGFNNKYYANKLLNETRSFNQTQQDHIYDANQQPSSSLPQIKMSRSSKVDTSETADKNKLDGQKVQNVTPDYLHSPNNPPSTTLMETETCLRIVHSNLQSILSGEMTPLTKITEETMSNDSMKYSNLSRSSKNAINEVNFSFRKPSNTGSTVQRKPAKKSSQEITRKEQNDQQQPGLVYERRTKQKSENSMQGRTFATHEVPKKARSSNDEKYKLQHEDNELHHYNVNIPTVSTQRSENVINIFNLENLEDLDDQDNILARSNDFSTPKNSKSQTNSKSSNIEYVGSNFDNKPIIVFPCTINELETTPVKDTIKKRKNEFESSDMESTFSNESEPPKQLKSQLNKVAESKRNSGALLHNNNLSKIQEKRSNFVILNNDNLQEICLQQMEEMKDYNRQEQTNAKYLQRNEPQFLLEADDDTPENEELKDIKIRRLANSFKKNIMQELHAANLLQQDKVIRLIMNNGNKNELKQLDDIITKNVNSVLKEKVISAGHSEDISESLDASRRQSSCDMYSKEVKLDIQNCRQCNTNVKRFDNSSEIKARCLSDSLRSESTGNINDNIQTVDSNIDILQQRRENEANILKQLIYRFSNEADLTFLESNLDSLLRTVAPNEGNARFFKNRQPVSNMQNASDHSKSPQNNKKVNNNPLGQILGSSNHIISNLCDIQKHWANSDKKSYNISRIPKCVNMNLERGQAKCSQAESFINQTKPRTAPVKCLINNQKVKNPMSRTNLEAFGSRTLLTKLLGVIEKQENRMAGGSSCSTVINSSKTKASSILFTKNDRNENRTSTFEKRKQYGELIRRKIGKAKNESSLGLDIDSLNHDCIYCCPQQVLPIKTERKIQEQLEKKVSTSRPSSPQFDSKYCELSTSRQPTIRVLSSTDRYGSEPKGSLNDHQASNIDCRNLYCYACNKLCCCCKTKPLPDEDKVEQYSPVSPAIKPVPSENSLKQQHKTIPDEQISKEKPADVYQTSTAAADHANVVPAFKNKFKSKSTVSLLGRESIFSVDSFSNRVTPNSTASAFSVDNKTIFNSKSSILLCRNGSDKVFYSLGELKRSMHYKRMGKALHLRKRSASGTPMCNFDSFSSTSKNLLETIEQNRNDASVNVESLHTFCNSMSEHLHKSVGSSEKHEPQAIFKKIHELGRIETHLNTKQNCVRQQLSCEKKTSCTLERVSSKSTVDNNNKDLITPDLDKDNLKDTHPNLLGSSKPGEQPHGDLKKLNNSGEVPQVKKSQNQCKRSDKSIREVNKIKNDNNKRVYSQNSKRNASLKVNNSNQIKMNDGKKQQKSLMVNQLKESSNHSNKSIYKASNKQSGGQCSNRNTNAVKVASQRKIHHNNNQRITNRSNDERNKTAKSSALKNKNQGKTLNYKRNSIEMSLPKDTACNKASFTVFNPNKKSLLQRRQTRINKRDSEECFKIFTCNNVLKLENTYSLTFPASVDNININDFLCYENVKKSKLFCCDQYFHGDDRQFCKHFCASCPKLTKTHCKENESKLLNTFFHQDENFEHDVYDSKHLLLKPFPAIISLPLRVKVVRFSGNKKELHSNLSEKHFSHTSSAESNEGRKKTFSYWPQPPRCNKPACKNCISNEDHFQPENKTLRSRFEKASHNETNPRISTKPKQSKFYKFLPKMKLRTESPEMMSIYATDAVWNSDSIDSCTQIQNTFKKVIKPHQANKLKILNKISSSVMVNFFPEVDTETYPIKPFNSEYFKHYQQGDSKNTSCNCSDKCTQKHDGECHRILEIVPLKSHLMAMDNKKQTTNRSKVSLRDMLHQEISCFTVTETSVEGSNRAEVHHKTNSIFQGKNKLPKKPTNLFQTLKDELMQTLLSSNSLEETVDEPIQKSTETFNRATYLASRNKFYESTNYDELSSSPNTKLSEAVKEFLTGSFGKCPLSYGSKNDTYKRVTTWMNNRKLSEELLQESHELLNIWLPESPYLLKEAIEPQFEENSDMWLKDDSLDNSMQSLYNDEHPEVSSTASFTSINSDINEVFTERIKQLFELKIKKIYNKSETVLDEYLKDPSMLQKLSSRDLAMNTQESSTDIFSEQSLQKSASSSDTLLQIHMDSLENANKPSSEYHECNHTICKELCALKDHFLTAFGEKFDKSFTHLIDLKLNEAVQVPDATVPKKQHLKMLNKPIKVLQNIFRKPAKKSAIATSSSFVPPRTRSKDDVGISLSQSTELSLESTYRFPHLRLKSLLSFRQLLKKALKEEPPSEPRNALSKLSESPKGEEESLPLLLIQNPSKQVLEKSLKEFLIPSLRDLSQQLPRKISEQPAPHSSTDLLVQQKSSMRLLEDLVLNMRKSSKNVVFKKSDSQASLFREPQRKPPNKHFTIVNSPWVLFSKENVKEKHTTKNKICLSCTGKFPSSEDGFDSLLKKMANMPLQEIVKLHQKQTGSGDPHISFRNVVNDLQKDRPLKDSNVTKSQERILQLLNDYKLESGKITCKKSVVKKESNKEKPSSPKTKSRPQQELSGPKAKLDSNKTDVEISESSAVGNEPNKTLNAKKQFAVPKEKSNSSGLDNTKTRPLAEERPNTSLVGDRKPNKNTKQKQDENSTLRADTTTEKEPDSLTLFNETIKQLNEQIQSPFAIQSKLEKKGKIMPCKGKSNKVPPDRNAEKKLPEKQISKGKDDSSLLSNYKASKKVAEENPVVNDANRQNDSKQLKDSLRKVKPEKSVFSSESEEMIGKLSYGSDMTTSDEEINKNWYKKGQLSPTKNKYKKKAVSDEANTKLENQGNSNYATNEKLQTDPVSDDSGKKLEKKEKFKSLNNNEKASDATTAKRQNDLKKLKDSLTDKELFEKLLDSYEREEQIVQRLSADEDFIRSQLELAESSVEVLQTHMHVINQNDKRDAQARRDESGLEDIREELERAPKTVARKADDSSASIASLKASSKTKNSGFKSRVTRLFKTNSSERLKEIVAPRAESYKKDSVDLSYITKNRKVEESLDGQKVTFSRGAQPFDEEKKMLGGSSTGYLGVKRDDSFAGVSRKSIDSNDSNAVQPAELGKCFLRGFRTDNIALDGNTCLLLDKGEQEKNIRSNLYNEAVIDFSERDSPLEYLLALGFSIDEASNAIKDEDVKNRLYAAITEARIWVNQINTIQGTLLYLVAYKAKPKTMRYFLQLVEAIINNRINNAVKLNSFLRVLEKVEDGDLTMIHILGSDKFEDEDNEEKIIKKQLRQLFINVYKIAQHEASLKGKVVSEDGLMLLRLMAARYRAGLHPHLELIARYIGQGLLHTEIQLEAAMIYLSRLDTADVNLKEFEHYCAIHCKEDKKGTK